MCDSVAPYATYVDTVSYTIIDQDGLTSNTAIITITVYCDRNPPIAQPDFDTTTEYELVNVPVLENDSDPDNDPISVNEITSPPSYGTAEPQPDGTITYTPDQRANDKCDTIFGNSFTDTFEYEIIDDGDKQTATATVTITVNCVRTPPLAVDDQDTTDENTPRIVDVITNDYDPDDGETVSVDKIINQPDIGSVQIVSDGIEYTPGEQGKRECRDIVGADPDQYVTTFEYQIVDSSPAQLTDIAQVTMTVTCVRVSPTAVPDEKTTNEDQSVCFNPVNNDFDPENDEALTLVSVEDPSVGSVTQNGNNVCYDPGQGGKDKCIEIASLADEFIVEFGYTIKDQDDQLTADSTITIVVRCERGQIEAVNDFISTDEDTPKTINVLTNDVDPEGNPEDTLDVTSVTQPDIGTLTNNGDGTVTYTPGQEGNDKCDDIAGKGFEPDGYTTQATYSVIDEDDKLTDSAIIFIDVLCNRATPETQPDYIETDENTPSDPIDPTANDTDPEGEDLELVEVDQPAIGDITKDGNNVLYTPGDEGKQRCRDLALRDPRPTGDEDSYTQTVTYTVKDSDDEETAQDTITIKVRCLRAEPIAKPDEVNTDEETSVSLNPLEDNGNGPDEDPEGGGINEEYQYQVVTI